MKTEKSEESNLAWHRHPVAVSLFSIVIGSFLLGKLQNYTNAHKALQEKRYAVLSECMDYTAKVDSNLRAIDYYNKSVLKGAFSKAEDNKAQADLQTLFSSTAEFQRKISLDLGIYFSTDKPWKAFDKFQEAFLEIYNKAYMKTAAHKECRTELENNKEKMSALTNEIINSMKSDLN